MTTPDVRQPGNTSFGYSNARKWLLVIGMLSVFVPFALHAFDGINPMFSAWIPHWLFSTGFFLSEEAGNMLYVWGAGAAGLVLTVPYFLCWFFSKKHVGWMIGALALWVIDSILFTINSVALIALGNLIIIVNLLLRVCALASLIVGVVFRLRS